MSAIAMSPSLRGSGRTSAAPRAVRASRAPRLDERAPHLAITRRGRAVLVALALVLALGAAFVGGRAVADAPAAPQRMVQHVVVEGETLWQIADAVTPRGQSVRETVTELVRVNGLPSDQVMAGQTILTPSR
ncbi:LysM peptidoglycan-binding domain-containing protein [Cellulomonas sp. JH27-2]|uniref:LysM peptidoglycan-binding domain-containing protein n=1 Tax=Cellulomonas sp. JH27-2 TaxID=2774139 RepID=UPI00177D20F6|nr:LysM peptidoglycan-binding domain-containing protein [Cellulomonas sp. JH27-2]MBD8060616.1 LysM peptidoglycan-binding domain-containing protein [Cellulomonas sp. JH27-2]